MPFNSIVFIYLFYPIVTVLFFLIPRRTRTVFIFLANLFFYAWGDYHHLGLLLFISFINYGFGLYLSRLRSPWLFRLGIVLNLLTLIYFKYLNFIVTNLNNLIHSDLRIDRILLPLGISFYIFKSISYLVDIKNSRRDPIKSYFEFGAYFMFFPTIISGPITRFEQYSEQWLEGKFEFEKFYLGIERFVIGLAKKMILANTLGIMVDKIYTQAPLGIDIYTAWLGVVFYGLQLYFDFSGYSDMAIGIGKSLGISIPENFNYPYQSKSVTEFWRRWHISLSSWFKFYVYIPIGGSRKGNVYLNLLIVFILTGLWHGSNWIFLIWGLWHGAAMLIERLLRNIKMPFPNYLKWFLTICWVFVGWVFFRSPNLHFALEYVKILFGLTKVLLPTFKVTYYINSWVLLAFILSVLFSSGYVLSKYRNFPELIRYTVVIILLIINIVFIINSSYNPFIYFQF